MLRSLYKKGRKILCTPLVLKDWWSFRKKHAHKRFSLKLRDMYPIVFEKTKTTGFDRHYVYHTSWAARKVREINPEFHTDISSSLYFSGIVSAFVPVKFYDYRPADLVLSGFESHAADLMSLPFPTGSVKSISCLHVIEHIGLGRYGDPIDPEGDLKAIEELKRVVAPGGSLLFVTPIGKNAKIEFNAHRIYTLAQIKEYFADMEMKECTLIPENKGTMIVNARETDVEKENYACGCFHFIKK
jgi:SAM-dependent methyltransferase